jgi:hypothetical protein
MPAQPFTVHVDPDDLARQDLAAAVSRSATTDQATDRSAIPRHGARDGRLAARQRSEREHASRASGAAQARSYAFRRS